MPLHPIEVVDNVLSEYREHLITEFRARDEGLRNALLAELDKAKFLAQEPFFQTHRPFKAGKRWGELSLDPALADVMIQRSESEHAYLHQSDALEHLLQPEPTPLVVTTGTGSGKTECFLLPVIQNALRDASALAQAPGITAILVYPMNALANDQEERIREYLKASKNHHVRVAKYDRSTSEAEREAMRNAPPQILLTNYMMLEYLLVRPKDRAALFANHRCRFVVLDEVHSYRGALGANIALLLRRLAAHLRVARQDLHLALPASVRFPALVPVGTSATIKSIDEAAAGERTAAELKALRDAAVRDFFSRLAGVDANSIRVLGEELRDVTVPPEAAWPAKPVAIRPPKTTDLDAVSEALAVLADAPPGTDLQTAARKAAILWKLGELLARKPLSVSALCEAIRETVPERRDAAPDALAQEVTAALTVGAALPDGTPGALRLRTHRFLRGGWRFHRCIDPVCGKLVALGEGKCVCGMPTAPLHLCRSCGAHVLAFAGPANPEHEPLKVAIGPDEERTEWYLYDRDRLDVAGDDGSLNFLDKEMKDRQVLVGSFDPTSLAFKRDDSLRVRAVLAPAASICLVCGARSGGAGRILSAVSLGTSAAVRVVCEGLVEALGDQNQGRSGHDGKERLLIFADSRQDAAHQARYITYSARYDRMRRRLVRVVEKGPVPLSEAIHRLLVQGVEERDNPHTLQYDDAEFLPTAARERARPWEEAPLLDDLSVSATYRATVFNLGMVGVRYEKLGEWVKKRGESLASGLGLSLPALTHLSRCVLDEFRLQRALSRPMLQYHPESPSCPPDFREAADWERRIKLPHGYACDEAGKPVAWLDEAETARGVRRLNLSRREGVGGGSPRIWRQFQRLVRVQGGIRGSEPADLLAVVAMLMPQFIQPVALHGYKDQMHLLQLNADAVVLDGVKEHERYRCERCTHRMYYAWVGAPCPNCEGTAERWLDEEAIGQSRYAKRLRKDHLMPLRAAEHTAQITGTARAALEDAFKGPPSKSKLNVLACSPTLEMGIDVGALDGVLMRNVPPRPDNYAQRGGRAGRRSRVGVVVSYARNTPHDLYFYDRPTEMISGEVPAPPLSLGNRNVLVRHLNAIALGSAEPGLRGRMGEYVTFNAELVTDNIEELLAGFDAQKPHAVKMAMNAWGEEILGPAGLFSEQKLREELDRQSGRIRELFERVRLQVATLDKVMEQWRQTGQGDRAAFNASDLKRKILGILNERQKATDKDADDRSAGHPMRRFAEFGILPGYEFPSEPATLRLLQDQDSEETISVVRRFGLAQYQPEAIAHARGHRWKVVGLDTSSPWNPKSEYPSWEYLLCGRCRHRFGHDEVRCGRCGEVPKTQALPAWEFGGFLAVRHDAPVLEEEERFAMGSLVRCFPQWDGTMVSAWELPTGFRAELRQGESVRWLNESKPPSDEDRRSGMQLHDSARGFPLCPTCGRMLKPEPPEKGKKKGAKKPKKAGEEDSYGHAKTCERLGQSPRPVAITAATDCTTLRLHVALPEEMSPREFSRWGRSLGYALRTGMRQLYLLDGPEIEVELEGPWVEEDEASAWQRAALTFIDPAVGGSGFLERAGSEFHLVAAKALEHLNHEGCETACYRCLKSYQNQRHHADLNWPSIVPDLESLALTPPVAAAVQQFDPTPWLAAYAAGVGSPLELEFLRAFEKAGLDVEKQVPVSASPGEPPISTADFVLTGTRVAVYVDSASFHVGERLRRDHFIRSRLAKGSNAWQVETLRAADLREIGVVIERLRSRGAANSAAS
ncbi:DEAD/DEAH box helicase [Myxococcus sp. AM001]|nr:DEAD/DEAH box helicase [Myxococcus sp. AM001]